MNSDILKDAQTLEEKLEAIDKAMAELKKAGIEKAKQLGNLYIPEEPTPVCDGCQ